MSHLWHFQPLHLDATIAGAIGGHGFNQDISQVGRSRCAPVGERLKGLAAALCLIFGGLTLIRRIVRAAEREEVEQEAKSNTQNLTHGAHQAADSVLKVETSRPPGLKPARASASKVQRE